jgi:predicted ester cyclase
MDIWIFFIIITYRQDHPPFNRFLDDQINVLMMQSPIRRIFEEAFNLGNLAVIDELASPDLFSHNNLAGTPNGPHGLKLMVSIFRTAFPDLKCVVDDEIVAGDRFAARWSIRGTHLGMFLGSPPTGKRVDALGIIIGRIEDGRIIEDWTLTDQLGILQQLGVVPPSGQHQRHGT